MNQTYQNLLPKNIFSDDAFSLLTRRVEDFRKTTSQSTELATQIKKSFETQAILNQNLLIHVKIEFKKSNQSCN